MTLRGQSSSTRVERVHCDGLLSRQPHPHRPAHPPSLLCSLSTPLHCCLHYRDHSCHSPLSQSCPPRSNRSFVLLAPFPYLSFPAPCCSCCRCGLSSDLTHSSVLSVQAFRWLSRFSSCWHDDGRRDHRPLSNRPHYVSHQPTHPLAIQAQHAFHHPLTMLSPLDWVCVCVYSGQGIFAKVKLGEDEFRQKVAIKIFDKLLLSRSQHQLLQVEKELNSLRCCHHPNIVQFYEVLETDSKIYLVMEHLAAGELYDYILDQGKLGEPESARLFAQIVSAVQHCHSHGIVHRDLKVHPSTTLTQYVSGSSLRPAPCSATVCS